jgi:ADP-heptose:LPS heptosyltransferase
MLAKSENWCFLLMEDRAFADSLKDPSVNTFAYADLFGDPEHAIAPFGQVMKCLAKLASLCVGVPAGPYHLAAQVEALPTVGVWLEHLPSWYDEPRTAWST